MTPLWIDNFQILYEKNFLFEILPSSGFDFNRKLNSLVRLSIFYTLIMYLLNKDKNKSILLIPISVGFFTIIMGRKLKSNNNNREIINLQNHLSTDPIEDVDLNCKVPTKNNPFMNPMVNSENNSISPCLSYNNKGIQRNIETQFNNGLYREASDIFSKNNSQRQFYTVPSKTYPNDQDAFKKWLYSTPPTCKEGNGIQCAANQIGVRRGAGSDEIN